MKTLEFYGKTIKIEDISFYEQRNTRLYSLFSIFVLIINWIILISFLLFLYGLYEDGKEILIPIVSFFIVAGGIISFVGFLFDVNKSIVEITLSNGIKIKSPKLKDADAEKLYKHISKSINKE